MAALAVAWLLSACGVELADSADTLLGSGDGAGGDGEVVGSDIAPATTSVPPTTASPPVDVEVIGDDGSDLNKVAANAVADIEGFWATVYPEIYGEDYRPVSGGFYAIDSGTDPSGLPCAPSDLDAVLYNAYYCPPDDAVAWDQESLFPDLASQFGDFAIAVVLAHEWGHAIQTRADVNESTVITELQADCFAGAWVNHVRTDDDARFDISIEDLDLALAGILSLEDAPGSLATDPNAHGSGFDRVGAFQEGYEETVERCARYTDGDPVPYQFPFSDNDLATGGDLPFTETDGVEGIDTSAFTSLELYWTDQFPGISGGAEWEPLKPAAAFSADDPPTCNGKEVTQFRLFFCVADCRLLRGLRRGGDHARRLRVRRLRGGRAVRHPVRPRGPGPVGRRGPRRDHRHPARRLLRRIMGRRHPPRAGRPDGVALRAPVVTRGPRRGGGRAPVVPQRLGS